MTRILIVALKILFVVILAAAVAFGALLLADYKGWPRWTIGVALAGAFFLIVLILFLRRYYYRRREEKFVRRVVDQDQQAIDAAPVHERRSLVELQERWTAAVAALRGSQLRHRGDPLYRLPWFMVFGETASGKSTAVSHARLKNILTDAGPARGIAGTRNCDWWFFKNAVVLDAAGRYAVPLQDEDKAEWERFLVLLAKYRRKEPLNGLVVTLPADRLLSDDADALMEYGRSIRLRIDQLMRVLGAKFPVYLLITKIDLILGMTALAETLPEAQRGQAMGHLNASEAGDPLEFLDSAIVRISSRLKALRLRPAPRAGAAGRALLFPDEFERLTPGIRAFAEGAFHENPYQETPFLRGCFISSGRQSGMTRSGVLGALESFKDRQWRLPDTGLGLFLRDFFDVILPGDRTGYRRLGEYLSWHKITSNLALAAWLLLLLTGIGVAALSYMHVRGAMQPVYAAFERAPQLGSSLTQDMVTLGLLRDKIAAMEQRLHSRALPSMGFTQGRRALTGLKRNYTQWFRAFVLDPTDAAMRERFIAMEGHPRDAAMISYLEYLVWRVDTLKARAEGRPRPDTAGQEGPLQALSLAFGGNLPYVSAYFPDMYRSYAIWENETGKLQRERAEMQMLANRIVELEGRDLHWLIEWAGTRSNLPEITLDAFWPGPGRVRQAPRVSGAFTRAGKTEIERLLDQVTLVAVDQESFRTRVDAFWDWYAAEYFERWTRFARSFGRGMDKLLAKDEWQNAGAAMATLENPYFRLLARMDEEFEAVKAIRPGAEIQRLTHEFVYISHRYAAQKKKTTLEGKIAEKIQRLEAHLERLDNSLAAAEGFTEYLKQLEAFIPVTAEVNAAYQFTLENYGQASGDGPASPVVLAMASLQRMRSLLGRDRAEEEAFWHLMTGPLEFLVTLATYESACGVNAFWQSQVVAETTLMPEPELWRALFGESGMVGQFVTGAAKPFLKRTPQGWLPGSWMGVPFPFRKEFLSFLDLGALRRQQLQPKYTVSIGSLPTNVNREARSEPYQTRLTLQCAARPQTLDNYNAPSNLEFVWEPATCDDVDLTIYFRETSVTQSWKGQWAFREFLRAFRDGRETFTPEDFPSRKELLQSLGIRQIEVNYSLKNAEPILSILDYPQLKVPGQAAQCWSGLGHAGVSTEGRPQ